VPVVERISEPIAGPIAKIWDLARAVGVLRPRDLVAHGIARHYLRIAERQGLVVRSGRGLYTPADAAITEFHTFAEAAKRAPRGVICLLSALRFHDIGTQNPFEVWIAIGEKDRRPRSDNPRMRTVRFSKQSLEFGQKTHRIEGVPTRIFSVAKTVADCFKYRNKIGLDVALEALRESLKNRKATTADLWKAAKVCRVANVMRPYMEALI
jgi:predicted transcriptional regulator of viral defense system